MKNCQETSGEAVEWGGGGAYNFSFLVVIEGAAMHFATGFSLSYEAGPSQQNGKRS